MTIDWHEKVMEYYKDNPDSRLDAGEIEAMLRDNHEESQAQEIERLKEAVKNKDMRIILYQAEILQLKAQISELEGAAQCYRDDIKTMIDGAAKGWTVDRLRRYAVEVLQGIVKREDGE